MKSHLDPSSESVSTVEFAKLTTIVVAFLPYFGQYILGTSENNPFVRIQLGCKTQVIVHSIRPLVRVRDGTIVETANVVHENVQDNGAMDQYARVVNELPHWEVVLDQLFGHGAGATHDEGIAEDSREAEVGAVCGERGLVDTKTGECGRDDGVCNQGLDDGRLKE